MGAHSSHPTQVRESQRLARSESSVRDYVNSLKKGGRTMAATGRGTTEQANRIVQRAVDAAIRDGGEIGLQVAAYVNGELVVDAWAGLADETTGRRVDGDTLFPVFSVTKAVTAVALHLQAERDLVDYAMPIAYYWPEFGAHGKDKATVYDALTHQLSVPIMPLGVTPELMCDWNWMVQRIADMRPLFEPGTKSAYMSYTWGWRSEERRVGKHVVD